MSFDDPTIRELVSLKRGNWPSDEWQESAAPGEYGVSPYREYQEADGRAGFLTGLLGHIID